MSHLISNLRIAATPRRTLGCLPADANTPVARSEGTFEWTSGAPFGAYNEWGAYEPAANGTNPTDNCAAVCNGGNIPGYEGNFWLDLDCDTMEFGYCCDPETFVQDTAFGPDAPNRTSFLDGLPEKPASTTLSHSQRHLVPILPSSAFICSYCHRVLPCSSAYYKHYTAVMSSTDESERGHCALVALACPHALEARMGRAACVCRQASQRNRIDRHRLIIERLFYLYLLIFLSW